MSVLSDSEIDSRLSQLSGWERCGDAICKSYERGDFVGSVRFLDSLLPAAEEMGHHPDVKISWSTVTLTLSTHSQGGLTESDFVLAAKIDQLA